MAGGSRDGYQPADWYWLFMLSRRFVMKVVDVLQAFFHVERFLLLPQRAASQTMASSISAMRLV